MQHQAKPRGDHLGFLVWKDVGRVHACQPLVTFDTAARKKNSATFRKGGTFRDQTPVLISHVHGQCVNVLLLLSCAPSASFNMQNEVLVCFLGGPGGE